MMKILQMNISASIIILLVLIIRRVGKGRFKPSVILVLWSIVLLRLLIPFSVPVSLVPPYEPIAYLNGTHLMQSSAVTASGNQAAENAIGATASLVAAMANTESGASKPLAVNVHPLAYAWVVGAMICVAYIVIVHMRKRHSYQMAIPIKNPFIEEWMASNPLRRRYTIKGSDRILSPLTAGVLKPAILLPKHVDFDNNQTLGYILTHEYTHIRQYHVVWKAIVLAACCIHWFNPLVWVMLNMLNRDLENICDEAVVHQHGASCRRSYALLLLQMQTGGRNLFSVTLPFDKTAIEERIGMIMRKQRKNLTLLTLMVISLCAATAFATSPVSTESPDPDAPVLYAVEGTSMTKVTAKERPELLAQYLGLIGLEYDQDTDMLFFNGNPVRSLEDIYPSQDDTLTGWVQYDPRGTVDIEILRDFDAAEYGDMRYTSYDGKLVGVVQVSKPAVFYANNTPEIDDTAIVGSASDTIADTFAEYAPYGLTYDIETESLYYDGKLVRAFVDLMEMPAHFNDEGVPMGPYRMHTTSGGEVDVCTLRDFTEGNKLLELIVSPAEDGQMVDISTLLKMAAVQAGYVDLPR